MAALLGLLVVTVFLAGAFAIGYLFVRSDRTPAARSAEYTWGQFRLDTLNPRVPIERVLMRCAGAVPPRPPRGWWP